ncbi:MAG: glycosyltransferase [Gemmatimonadaceae bacterium]
MHTGTRAPRLLVCSDTYPPQVNGVSVVTALSVTGLQRRGWEVALVAPRYPLAMRNAFGNNGGLAVLKHHLALPSAPLPFYPDLRLALPHGRRVTALVEQFAPDVVHCATEFAIGWLGQRAAIKRGIPIVTSYHTDFSRYTDAYGVGWLASSVSAHLTRFHQRARRTFTASDPARAHFVGHGHPRRGGVGTRRGHRKFSSPSS